MKVSQMRYTIYVAKGKRTSLISKQWPYQLPTKVNFDFDPIEHDFKSRMWSRLRWNHFAGNADEIRLMQPNISVTVSSKTFTMRSLCADAAEI